MSRCAGRAAAAVLAVLAAGPTAAQDFAARYRAAEALRLGAAADPDAVRAAYAAAAHAFAALPAGATERAAALPAAAFAALQAGEPARAADWITQSIAGGAADALHAEIQVQALALSGATRAAVDAVHAWYPRQPAAVVRALAAVQPTVGGALCEAADSALREGRTEAGLLLFVVLVEASARHPTALANCALALRHVGRVREAEAHYREALAATPADPDLWNDLGLLHKGEGRDAEAVAAFARSRSLERESPPSGPATANLIALARAGRLADPAVRVPDPPAALAAVLARHPEAALARRLLVAELLAGRFPPDRADTRPVAR